MISGDEGIPTVLVICVTVRSWRQKKPIPTGLSIQNSHSQKVPTVLTVIALEKSRDFFWILHSEMKTPTIEHQVTENTLGALSAEF